MTALWIADAHLTTPTSPSYRAILEVLRQYQDQVDTLVLLGDFFELWLGDNRLIIARHRPLLDVIAQYRAQGTDLYYLKGNHDFLLGTFWEKQFGAQIIDEDVIFPWDGYRFFASHGEHIYLKDHKYRVMRKLLRSSLVERVLPRLGDEMLYRMSLRFASVTGGRANRMKQIEQQAASLRYARSHIEQGCHAAILGHTHVIQWHILSVNHAPRLYVNPGSWKEHGTYLWYQNGRFQLRRTSQRDPEILFDFHFHVA